MSQNNRHPYQADPYRAVRKSPSPDGCYDSSNSEFHSRSPSESSTSKLANTTTTATTTTTLANQDPYAPKSHGIKKKMLKPASAQEEKRANSYLPYSNHSRNPYDPVEPIYLDQDDDYLPSFNSPGQHHHHHHESQQNRGPVGSILQDNIVMDMMSDHHNVNDDDYETKSHLEQILPRIKKKKCGLGGQKLVIIVFVFIIIVGVISYFVWPRTPTLQFVDAALTSGTQPVYNDTIMLANWNVNFTVLNDDNFIPTNIQNLAVAIIENDSGQVFGRGNSGHLMLKAKAEHQVITVPISIDFHRDATNQAIKTLANACKIKEVDSANAPRQSLSITFEIVYYIAGIAWHPVAKVSPTSYFDCP